MDIPRGFRDKLEKYINSDKIFDIEMSIAGPAVYDYSCFGVDSNEKLSDDRYMMFFNQQQSPLGELGYHEITDGVRFTVNLGKLPATINKLVFTACIDGEGIMQDISTHKVKLIQGTSCSIHLSLNGNDFQTEKAIISIEIYRKDGWRMAAVARGFNGGLSDLLHFYGGEEISIIDEDHLSIPVELLGLSMRSCSCLKKYGTHTLGDLLRLSSMEILGLKNLGKAAAAEIIEAIRKSILSENNAPGDLPEDTQNRIVNIEQPPTHDNEIIIEGKKTVLQYLDETTVIKEIQDVFFYNINGLIVADIEVENLKLSARATGSLLRNDYRTAKSIVLSDYADISGAKGMGSSTRDEIMNKLKEITVICFADSSKSELIDSYITALCDDIRKHCPDLSTALYKAQINVIVTCNKGKLNDNINDFLADKELLALVYSERAVYKVFENYISKVLMDVTVMPLSELKQRIPRGLQELDIFNQMIDNMISKKIIDDTENGLRFHLSTIMDYVEMMEEGAQKDAIISRLQGETLEEIGTTLGVTRERVRQLVKKVLDKMPSLRENDYKYWYESYDITKDEFQNIFGLTEQSYNYLKISYKKGSKSLEELLDDDKINGSIAQRSAKEMYKYCVIIADEYVTIRRDAIVKRLFEVYYSETDCSVSDFYSLYMDFLKENNIATNEKLLYPNERAFEARLTDQRFAVAKYGRRLRYYSMDEYDLVRLFAELDLLSYAGLEFSTLKLFNTHPELMQDYNIIDEYELHNVLKKNQNLLTGYQVTLGRMPFLTIGESDRERQTVEFLFRVAPIELYDFGKAYEEEFGIRSETALANFVPFIDRYYSNGVFAVDYKIMSEAEYKIMQSKLPGDFYFISDIKDIYHQTFPNGDTEKINPYTLKTMGFLLYVDYVVSNRYSSCEEYIRYLLTSSNVVDMGQYDSRMTANQVFYYVLEDLRSNFDLLEIERSKYITFEGFTEKAPGITKEDLRQFTIDAAEFSNEEFFTIKMIRKSGFVSVIDHIGFDDWFYSALLRCNKNLRYSKVAGGILLSHIGRLFKRGDFFLYLMKKFKKINVMEFIKYIEDDYGLIFDRSDVTPLIGQANMYYDANREKIYLNREEYYLDI